MGTGIFVDIGSPPAAQALEEMLGKAYKFWADIREYALELCGELNEQWNFSKSFGWNCRIRNRKRVIVYLLPLTRKFKASFVLGERATAEAMTSKLSKDITDLISSAKVYAENRGFRIPVESRKTVKDIKKLIDIKLSN